eukprot:Sspe_Gene.74896::Locus_46807_Transcript_1_1_Confidence_1.000_Length_1484::g.74896::m.74896
MMMRRSRRSMGIPCGLRYSVPRMRAIPRLLAMTTTGARWDSSARFSQEKHSMSSMCTSSMNSTPGTISAFPSSRHSATRPSICSRTSDLISPTSPLNRARNPCCLLLITSISCSVTVCTTSFLFWSSPSGVCTNFTCCDVASKSLHFEKLRPSFVIFPFALSMVTTSPTWTRSFWSASIIFCPKSKSVSISVVFRHSLPVLPALSLPGSVLGFSMLISTTSPSMISVSSLIRTPIDLLKACVRASVLLISREKISLPAMTVNGTSSPRDWAIPIAIAVFPVPGAPARRTDLPAILPSLIIIITIPAAFRADSCPTMPCPCVRASNASSSPNPRMCECAPIRSTRVTSFTSASVLTSAMGSEGKGWGGGRGVMCT